MRKGPGRFARFEEHDMLFPIDSSHSEANDELNVSCKGVNGTVAFIENEAFHFAPKKQARSVFGSGGKELKKQARSVFGSGGKELKILHQEIVGVVKRSSCSFEVWYCQLASNRPGETKRKFLKSPEFTILPGGTDDFGNSPEEAVVGFIQYVRQSCCWGSRHTAPSVAILVHPASGKSKSSQQLQKTMLPILQDAAGLHVEVFDGCEPSEAVSVLNMATTDILVVLGSDGMTTEDQQAVAEQVMQQGNTQTVFIPFGSGGGLGSPKSSWCPHTTAHAICKGLVSNMSKDLVSDSARLPATNTPDRIPRHSKFVTAASGILNSIKDAKPDLQWKGEATIVGEVFRDLVNSSKQNIKQRCGALQAQVSQKASMGAAQQQQQPQQQPQQQNEDLLLDQDTKVVAPFKEKAVATKSWKGAQMRSSFAAVWGQNTRASLNREWSSSMWDSAHEGTVPAYRPRGGMSCQDSLSVSHEV